MLNCTYSYIYKEKELKKAFINNQYFGTIFVGIMLIVSIYGFISSFQEKKDVLPIAIFYLLSFLIIGLFLALFIDIIKSLRIYKNSLGKNQILKFENGNLYYDFGINKFFIPVKCIKKIKKTKYFYVFELDSKESNKFFLNPQIPHRSVRLSDLMLLTKELNIDLELK